MVLASNLELSRNDSMSDSFLLPDCGVSANVSLASLGKENAVPAPRRRPNNYAASLALAQMVSLRFITPMAHACHRHTTALRLLPPFGPCTHFEGLSSGEEALAAPRVAGRPDGCGHGHAIHSCLTMLSNYAFDIVGHMLAAKSMVIGTVMDLSVHCERCLLFCSLLVPVQAMPKWKQTQIDCKGLIHEKRKRIRSQLQSLANVRNSRS